NSGQRQQRRHGQRQPPVIQPRHQRRRTLGGVRESRNRSGGGQWYESQLRCLCAKHKVQRGEKPLLTPPCPAAKDAGAANASVAPIMGSTLQSATLGLDTEGPEHAEATLGPEQPIEAGSGQRQNRVACRQVG